jgi:DNA-binding response OmpR family regulator
MQASGGKLILVADDDADVLELVVFRLVHAGYEVITAADGEEAVELALARRPDLCLVDVMMPKLDGFAVTERVRAAPELAETKVLLLTASVHDSAVERGLAVGADDYIAKPFASERLLERVSAALGPDGDG